MNGRVLVGYATKDGATIGVAEKIGEVLGQRGFAVDVRPVREEPSLTEYAAVVLGSAINGGKWLPEAAKFLQDHATAIASVPFAAFCVHGLNLGATDKENERRHAYLDDIRALVKPTAEGFFAGRIEGRSRLEKWIMRRFGGTIAEGDARDWAAIARWARDLVL